MPEVIREDPLQAAASFSEQESHPSISVMQIVAIAKAYWKQVVMITLCLIAVIAVAIKFVPKTYTAAATLIVNADNKDPLAGQQFPVDVLGNYVATQVELMMSPVVLLPVIDRLHLTEDREFTAGFGGNSTEALRDYVQKNLAGALLIETGRGGQLVYVSASARDPVQAANIANAVGDIYLEEGRRRANEPAGERAKHYSVELAELRAKAAAAQDNVTAFRQQNGLTDLTAAATDNENQGLTTLEARLLDAKNERRALESKQGGSRSSADEALASVTVGQLKTQLSTLQSQMAQLSSTLGPRHPKVLELESQITTTQKQLSQEINVLSENIATQLDRARDLEQSLTRAVADQRVKVLHLRQQQDEGSKLALELESAQSVYKRALDGYDQIVFASLGNYTNVSFIGRANPPTKPSKPNKVKLMMMGVVLALMMGVAAPVAYEFLYDRRLRCRDDLELSFGIVVLAQFDPIPPALEPS